MVVKAPEPNKTKAQPKAHFLAHISLNIQLFFTVSLARQRGGGGGEERESERRRGGHMVYFQIIVKSSFCFRKVTQLAKQGNISWLVYLSFESFVTNKFHHFFCTLGKPFLANYI